MPLSRRALLGVTAASTGIAGCTGRSPPSTTAPTPPADATYATTDTQPSGNRVLAGSGDLAGVAPVDLDTAGRPGWLLAFGGAASRWVVVTADGRATSHRVAGGRSERLADHGTVATPPLAYATDDGIGLVDPPADSAAHTQPIGTDDGLLYVARDGDLVRRRAGEQQRFDVAAPPDARPVAIDERRYALYGDRTDRYRHGALGDTTEGSSLVIVDTAAWAIERRVRLDAPLVFEGLAPLVADLDDDGRPEIVTTVADRTDGARIRVYGTDDRTLATGPVYGPGWRHQLCVAPFPPTGRPELAVVRKPHVDRTVEYYRLDDDGLSITATRQGYASHTYGSRILAGGLAVDATAADRPALLVPTSDRRTLAGLVRTADGTEGALSLSLGGRLTTNLTGTTLDDGRVAVGAGTTAGVRIWTG
jgi:hypothetical protein